MRSTNSYLHGRDPHCRRLNFMVLRTPPLFSYTTKTIEVRRAGSMRKAPLHWIRPVVGPSRWDQSCELRLARQTLVRRLASATYP